MASLQQQDVLLGSHNVDDDDTWHHAAETLTCSIDKDNSSFCGSESLYKGLGATASSRVCCDNGDQWCCSTLANDYQDAAASTNQSGNYPGASSHSSKLYNCFPVIVTNPTQV